MAASNLTFQPLYWIHHDCWKVIVPALNGGTPDIKNHWGHIHLFFVGYNPSEKGPDAFSGEQSYHFSVDDLWGPRSGDANQQLPYRVIGTPKWYFHVQEVWRRMYVQPWDDEVQAPAGTILNRRGVRWDASSHTFGPFREGHKFFPLFVDGSRTLPVEYYADESRDQQKRDNWPMAQAKARMGSKYVEQLWIPPEGTADAIRGERGGEDTYPDSIYIHPLIEYQKVVQLNWERFPGWEAEHDVDSDNFGDGWDIDLALPLRVNGKYNSPFGPTNGVVRPIGEYFGSDSKGNPLVPLSQRPKNRKADRHPPKPPDDTRGGYDYYWGELGMKEEESEQPVAFVDPTHRGDGVWVQQCLGGIIQARAVVTIESKLGGRSEITVGSTQYLPDAAFAGTDQLAPASEP